MVRYRLIQLRKTFTYSSVCSSMKVNKSSQTKQVFQSVESIVLAVITRTNMFMQEIYNQILPLAICLVFFKQCRCKYLSNKDDILYFNLKAIASLCYRANKTRRLFAYLQNTLYTYAICDKSAKCIAVFSCDRK